MNSPQKCIRSAFWVGQVKAGAQAEFKDVMDRKLLVTMKGLPGVHDAQVLWPTLHEDQPPQVACQVLVLFNSRDDLARMLASPERQAMRADVVTLRGLFDGAISHIEYDVVG